MKPQTTAKDFFVYLGVIIGLYVSAISFLLLAFAILEKVLPLVGEYYGNQDGPIRSTVATLIIFLPAFLYLSRLVNKDLKSNPDKKEIWIRRWFMYLTLFIAGLTIAIDLVTLIQRFLSAEDLTLRFVLKVILVLLVAVSVFKYYFYDLKRNVSEFAKWAKVFVYAVSVITLGFVVWGIILVGSPSLQKARNLDDGRINDLSSIQAQVLSYWQVKNVLPKSLSDLNDPLANYSVPKDPRTGLDFEYKTLSKNSFEICATFETESVVENSPVARPLYYPQTSVNENWQHGIGRTCFDRTIDEAKYKPGIPGVVPVKY